MTDERENAWPRRRPAETGGEEATRLVLDMSRPEAPERHGARLPAWPASGRLLPREDRQPRDPD